MVYHRPGGMGAEIDAVGAQFEAGFPRTQYKPLASAEIRIHRISPISVGIPAGEPEVAE